MRGQYRIDSLWAFTVIDDDGTEGVMTMHSPAGLIPLVGADLAMVEKLKPFAREFARQHGKAVTLAHFSTRTVQEVYEVDGSVTKDLYDVARQVTQDAGLEYHDPRSTHGTTD